MTLRTAVLLLLLLTAVMATWLAITLRAGQVETSPTAQLPQSGATVGCDPEVTAPELAEAERTTPRALPSGETPKSNEVRFNLTGVASDRCRGVASVYRKHGVVQTVPITGLEVVLPAEADVRRIELAVPGYCVVSFLRPFEATSKSMTVAMLPAGEVLVDVRDSMGHVLPGRTIYCYPQTERRRSPEDSVKYRTTPWAVTDARGQAVMTNVLPGEYKVDTVSVAEWRGATITGVQVFEGQRSSCVLTVPVLDPSTFGGFTLAADQVPFPSDASRLRVEDYKFWTENGKSWPMHRFADSIRCIVYGESTEVVRGRVQRRNPDGEVVIPSKESEPIAVTVGSVRHLAPTWSDAAVK